MKLTLKGKVVASQEATAILLDAMRCATTVYNGLLWHLREEYQRTGKTQAPERG